MQKGDLIINNKGRESAMGDRMKRTYKEKKKKRKREKIEEKNCTKMLDFKIIGYKGLKTKLNCFIQTKII